MQIRVSIAWHVKVEHDIDLLNINTTAKELSSDKNARFELLEALVNPDSIWVKMARRQKVKKELIQIVLRGSLTSLRGSFYRE